MSATNVGGPIVIVHYLRKQRRDGPSLFDWSCQPVTPSSQGEIKKLKRGKHGPCDVTAFLYTCLVTHAHTHRVYILLFEFCWENIH